MVGLCNLFWREVARLVTDLVTIHSSSKQFIATHVFLCMQVWRYFISIPYGTDYDIPILVVERWLKSTYISWFKYDYPAPCWYCQVCQIRRISWMCHVQSVDDHHVIKNILNEGICDGSKRGRPRERWITVPQEDDQSRLASEGSTTDRVRGGRCGRPRSTTDCSSRLMMMMIWWFLSRCV
jgi:hypothetical protein